MNILDFTDEARNKEMARDAAKRHRKVEAIAGTAALNNGARRPNRHAMAQRPATGVEKIADRSDRELSDSYRTYFLGVVQGIGTTINTVV